MTETKLSPLELAQLKYNEARAEAIAKHKEELLLAKLSAPINVDVEIRKDSKVTINEAVKHLSGLLLASNDDNDGKDREFRKVWGVGSPTIHNLIALAQNLQYSPQIVKDAFTTVYPAFDEDIVDSILHAAGQPEYYSPKENAIIPEIPYDALALKRTLGELCSEWGIEVDTNRVDTERLATNFKRSKTKAQQQYLDTKAQASMFFGTSDETDDLAD